MVLCCYLFSMVVCGVGIFGCVIGLVIVLVSIVVGVIDFVNFGMVGLCCWLGLLLILLVLWGLCVLI